MSLTLAVSLAGDGAKVQVWDCNGTPGVLVLHVSRSAAWSHSKHVLHKPAALSCTYTSKHPALRVHPHSATGGGILLTFVCLGQRT